MTELLAGRYEVTVTLTGFKTYVQRDIVLSANERVALRPIVLEVGQLKETISVTAEAARIQTLSGERSGLITQEQIKDSRPQGPRLHGHAEAAARGSSTRRTARRPAGTTWAASASTAGATTPST